MKETQQTVTDWQEATFGPTTTWQAFQRMQKEYWELRDLLHAEDNGMNVTHEQRMGELADVLITLYRVARYAGVDLNAAVNLKMAINRKRTWVVDETGNGQHV